MVRHAMEDFFNFIQVEIFKLPDLLVAKNLPRNKPEHRL